MKLRFVTEKIQRGRLEELLHGLYAENISSVLVEGGTKTLNRFITAGLWDEARVITGSISIGQGVAAPLLTHAHLTHTDVSEGDILRFYEPQHTEHA